MEPWQEKHPRRFTTGSRFPCSGWFRRSSSGRPARVFSMGSVLLNREGTTGRSSPIATRGWWSEIPRGAVRPGGSGTSGLSASARTAGYRSGSWKSTRPLSSGGDGDLSFWMRSPTHPPHGRPGQGFRASCRPRCPSRFRR